MWDLNHQKLRLDVSFVWDLNSAQNAVMRLFKNRSITVYCEMAEGASIYNLLPTDASSNVIVVDAG